LVPDRLIDALILHTAPTDVSVLNKALSRAYSRGYNAAVLELLKLGASAAAVDGVTGHDLFNFAMRKGDHNAVAMFLQNGFEVINPNADHRWIPSAVAR